MDAVETARHGSETDHVMPIRNLVRPIPQTDPSTLVRDVKARIEKDEPISAVIIVKNNAPAGLVMSLHLNQVLSHRYGISLYYDKPVSKVMDAEPLIINSNTPIEEAARLAMGRSKLKIYDHIIVTEGGDICGIVSVQDILIKLAEVQRRNANALNEVNRRLKAEVLEREKAQKDLINLNSDLEKRVFERTAELQLSYERLKSAKEAAEAANRAKSDFLANMSHELRTPLNHIIGFTELVAEEDFGELNEIQSEYLNDVLNSSKHLLSLINDILDLSKVEAGRMELECVRMNLSKTLEKSLLMIKEKALKNGIRLSTRLDDVPETVGADERKIKQILYNLLSNAVKFTPSGGSIELSACRLNGHDIIVPDHLTHANIKNPLIISVKDTGIGLKKENLKGIFEPFEQVESARNRKYQGTGLGLSLTKQFVELHSGCIWAESEGEGKGATFRFLIPSEQMSETINV